MTVSANTITEFQIVLNHNGDWTGEVRIAWYDPSDRKALLGNEMLTGPLPSLRECWCAGLDLIAGRFTPVVIESRDTSCEQCAPPVHVLTRATALAVESFLRSKIERALDVEVFIRRGKL